MNAGWAGGAALALPWTEDRKAGEVIAVLDSGIVAIGPRTVEFETRFAELVGARHAVAVNSCWAGFHLAFTSFGLGPRDEILTSAGVPIPTAAAIHHVGARAVVVDVVPETLTLDPDEASRKITPTTRAIVPTHFGGCPSAMDEILALAARHDLRVIEDAVRALPASYHGRTIGSIGEVTVFGFRADATSTKGERGILTTDRPDLASLFRAGRFYGIANDSREPRRLSERSRHDDSGRSGGRYGAVDFDTALNVEQLRNIPRFHGIRSYYASLYELGLSDLSDLALPKVPFGVQHAWSLYPIRLKPERLTMGRNTFVQLLRRENIRVGDQFVPLNAHAYYRKAFGLRPGDFPRALDAYQHSVSLPLNPSLSEAAIWDVIHAVRTVVLRHSRRRSP
jgi:dTDP-4-amino-4,6-dideoxygalactose transaminase